MMKARDNPFSTRRTDRLAFRSRGCGWPDLMARLETLSYRGAIVGPDGSGKTTLLEELACRLSADFRIRRAFLSADRRCLPEGSFFDGIRSRDLFLIDGADLLGAADWARCRHRTSRAGGLIITSHRTGLLPLLIECRTDPALLADLVAELAGPADINVEALHAAFAGNIRDILRHLYDVYARDGQSRAAATAAALMPGHLAPRQ